MCQLNFVSAMCFKRLIPGDPPPPPWAAQPGCPGCTDPAMAQLPAWGLHWLRVPLLCLFSSLWGWKGGSHAVPSPPHVTGSPGRAAQPYGNVGSMECRFHWGWGQLDGATWPWELQPSSSTVSQIMSAQPTCVSSCSALRQKRFL